MATFLLCYSSATAAKSEGLPPAGTAVEIETIADLDALMARLRGHSVIIRTATNAHQAPSWADALDLFDADERDEWHYVATLPDNWRSLRWIEVYNGYRE